MAIRRAMRRPIRSGAAAQLSAIRGLPDIAGSPIPGGGPKGNTDPLRKFAYCRYWRGEAWRRAEARKPRHPQFTGAAEVFGSSKTDVHKGPDLGRLSAAERRVLELLAEGHTAKSIAGLTEQSEGAINERLRSARRKTGVGSSRELARLIGVQKNRAENFGISALMSPVAVDGVQATPRRARLASLKGSLMLVTLCAAATALVLQAPSMNSQIAQTGAVNDPLVGSAIYEGPPNFHILHDQLRGEPRAQAWAVRTEAALRVAFDRAFQAGGRSEPRVICGSTLCEAAGVIAGDHAQVGAAMRALQGRNMTKDAEKAGLSSLGIEFAAHSHPTRGGGMTFLTYWKRQGD